MATNTQAMQAWVLHKRCSGDTSAHVSFFTREAGLVHSLCKGGRTPKKQALLQAFTPLWISVAQRHECFYTQSIESTSPPFQLTRHSLFSGLYVNEILYYVLSPNSPDIKLFDAYSYTLSRLALTTDKWIIEPLLRRFEWVLLQTCGYSFSLTQEARTAEPIVTELSYRFVAGEGFILDNRGIPGLHILALAQDDLSEIAYLKSSKIIMRQAIEHLLDGKMIKARSLYR